VDRIGPGRDNGAVPARPDATTGTVVPGRAGEAPRVTEPADDGFLQACGAGGPLVLALKGPRGPMRHSFARPFVVVGRAPGADLRLDHPAVSRRHVYLQVIAGRLFAVDLASRTGTHWPDGPRPMGWVGGGTPLRIGPFRLGPWGTPEGDPSEWPAPTARPDQPTGPAPILEFLDPTAEPSTWPMEPALVLLGCSPACKVQLSGPGASRFHASLVRGPGGAWAVDLLGRGGILINGASTRAAQLGHGDILQVGPHRIRLWYEAADLRPRPALPAVAEPVAWLMPRPEPGAPAGRDPAAEGLVVPLVQELGRLQQEMADQFQQGLAMMFRLFSGMHQEQMALVREELAEIRRLAEEQRALRAELGRVTTPPVPAPPPPGPLRPPRPPRPGAEEAHAALARRLEALQEEQQGRWQKLLRSVMRDG
jgi:pSer/pThr/pTyr-binding forkhead associated (FHA) protein